MKESSLQTRILNQLNAIKACKAINVHGNIHVETGTPDIIGAYKGCFFGIEVKVGKNNASKIQVVRLHQWHKVGGFTTVARESFDIDKFIQALEENFNHVGFGYDSG